MLPKCHKDESYLNWCNRWAQTTWQPGDQSRLSQLNPKRSNLTSLDSCVKMIYLNQTRNESNLSHSTFCFIFNSRIQSMTCIGFICCQNRSLLCTNDGLTSSLPVPKEHKGRKRLDVVHGRQFIVFVHINLDKHDIRIQLGELL